MEPSGPTLRVQLVGQPVVPAAYGKAGLVEFAKDAVLISTCLWYQPVFRDLLGYGIVVAAPKGTVTIRLQARTQATTTEKLGNIAITDSQ